MSKLTVYKASAGSGKTYTITKEYLDLLFADPINYKNTLAVTFTNKATEEMKSRILSELNNLASNASSNYIEYLCKKYNLTEKECRLSAKKILSNILHDYSRFSISTIDSFFQTIIRVFTKELGINAGYNIELNQNDVLDKSTDLLLMDIETNERLNDWLTKFAEAKIQDGKSWNLKKDIINLANQIFKEDFKDLDQESIERIKDKKFLNSYLQELNKIKDKFEKKLVELGKNAVELIEGAGLSVNDFSFKKTGVAGYLYNVAKSKKFEPGSRVLSALDNEKKWLPSSASSTQKVAFGAIFSDINTTTHEIVNFYFENFLEYNSVEKIQSNIFALGILADISSKVTDYTSDNNIFLLNEATHLINEITEHNDSSFIFEKIGNNFSNFMIDEFQDTSNMQWKNFKSLINNSLAENNKSLIVGDVKQAIYRWRNGDWKILAEQLEQDFNTHGVDTLTLDTNWRSSKNIIEFNNSIFNSGKQLLQNFYNNNIPDQIKDKLELEQEKIINAYSLHQQNVSENKLKKYPGYVNLNFVETEEDEDWKQKVLNKITSIIEQLQDHHYNLKDIAILVRKAEEGRLIADAILEHSKNNINPNYKYDIISNDSLYISNSNYVSFIIYIMSFLINSDDKINRAQIAYIFTNFIACKDLNNKEFTNSGKNELQDFLDILPEEFSNNIETIRKLPLYELTEKIIKIFNLNTKENEYPYLMAFQDLAQNFSKKNTADVSTFIDWWNQRGKNEVLALSENQDAIQIMSVHKSKGLEFKAVIIPFCDWEIDSQKHRSVFWCKPQIEPFNKISVLPLNYSAGLKDSIFFNDFYIEQLQSYIDNINLLYVATTRAEEVLISFSENPKQQKEFKLNTIGQLLKFLVQNSDNSTEFIPLTHYWHEDENNFVLGNLNSEKKKELFKTNNLELDSYLADSKNQNLSLKFNSEDYFNFEDELNISNLTPVNLGNLMHEIFQNIKYASDVDHALTKMEIEGRIDKKIKISLKDKIEKLLNDSETNDWFSKKYHVINERDILLGNNREIRPDRVIVENNNAIVIDYKFGKKESDSYIVQLHDYMIALSKLGYHNIKGYIWYIELNKKVEVRF